MRALALISLVLVTGAVQGQDTAELLSELKSQDFTVRSLAAYQIGNVFSGGTFAYCRKVLDIDRALMDETTKLVEALSKAPPGGTSIEVIDARASAWCGRRRGQSQGDRTYREFGASTLQSVLSGGMFAYCRQLPDWDSDAQMDDIVKNILEAQSVVEAKRETPSGLFSIEVIDAQARAWCARQAPSTQGPVSRASRQ